jgi:hypothetical protein
MVKGRSIITSLPKMTIDGQAQLDFAPSGVTWHLTCSAAAVLLPDKTGAKLKRRAGEHHPPSRHGRGTRKDDIRCA